MGLEVSEYFLGLMVSAVALLDMLTVPVITTY